MKLELKQILPYMPYDLKFIGTLDLNTVTNDTLSHCDIKHLKPILRSIHTITEEEAKELISEAYGDRVDDLVLDVQIGRADKFYGDMVSIHGTNKHKKDSEYLINIYLELGVFVKGIASYSINEWLFKNHFDVFGLIDKGLALEKQSKS